MSTKDNKKPFRSGIRTRDKQLLQSRNQLLLLKEKFRMLPMRAPEKAGRGVKTGYKRGGRKIEITLPPGVKTGERVRYRRARLKLDGKPGALHVHIVLAD